LWVQEKENAKITEIAELKAVLKKGGWEFA